MGAYVIFGRTFQAYQLSIATFSTVAAGVLYATSGKKTATAPPINAGSSEEEKFILDFLKQQEKEEKH